MKIKENKIHYTENQNAIIHNFSLPMYLTAGAGTGKTEVLVKKIILLLTDYDVPAEHIFVITYTNHAADEVKERIRMNLYREWVETARRGEYQKAKKLRQLNETVGMLRVSTIHGFCEVLLHTYGMYAEIPSNFKRKPFGKEMSDIINSVVYTNRSNPLLSGVPIYKIRSVIFHILKEVKRHGVVLDESFYPKNNSDYWDQLQSLILGLSIESARKIAELKKQQHIITTNDLMEETVKLLKNERVMQLVTEQISYLLIDEFQDTNTQQFHISETLMKAGVKLFLVGDNKQSIYSFQGADIESSQKAYEVISNVHQDSKEYILSENFRSDQVLLETINQIFNQEFSFAGIPLEFPPFKLLAPENFEYPVTSFSQPFQIEYQFNLSKAINEIVGKETINGSLVRYEDVFVLCRTNRQLVQLEKQLIKDQIPVFVVSGKGFYNKREIVDVYKLFSAMLNTERAYRNELVYTSFFDSCFKHEIDFSEFLDHLGSVFREESIDGILEYIYEKTGIFNYYDQSKNYQAVANLTKLRNIANELLSNEFIQPLDFANYLKQNIENNPEEEEAELDEIDKRKGLVTLMTIHKSKGLSLPIVLMPFVDENLIKKKMPDFIIDYQNKKLLLSDIFGIGLENPRYMQQYRHYLIKQLEEELRVLYVGMTRAKHLLVLGCQRNYSTLEYLYGKEDYVSWSQWVTDK